MTVETNNFITGRALNPYNQERSAGGSTGGEGGLLAVKGSVVGMGNDVGGSIRIPSAFCGLYGYKPSTVRVCLTGAGNLPLSM